MINATAQARRRWLAIGVLALVPACITVNVYFPAPAVQRAAEQIVQETWGPQKGASEAEAAPEPTSWLQWIGPRAAHAQEPNIDVSTVAIRTLKEAMKQRAPQLKPHLRAGHVGIGRDGFLVIRNADAVSLKERADLRRLVEAENKDRRALYEAIAEANGFGADRVDDIQRIFAETWADKAEKGWPVQKPDGSWGVK